METIKKENDKEYYIGKIEYFYANKIPIHITTKQRIWINGFITEISDDHFNVLEFKKGDTPVFWNEIFRIEKYITEETKK